MIVGHVVTIVLNAYLGPARGGRIHGAYDLRARPRREYVASRWPILERYTLASLLAQTVDDFGVVLLHDRRLSIDEYLRTSPAVRRLGDRFRAVGVDPIDFRGAAIESSFWRARPEEDRAILELTPPHAGRILVSHIDSDDCFARDTLARVRAVPVVPGLQAIVPTDGFVFDTHRRRLRRYHAASPPFFTLVFGRSQVESGYRPHGGAGHHYRVHSLMESVTLDGDCYLVTIHGHNDATRFEHGIGPDIDEPERSKILRTFGLDVAPR